MRLIDFDGEYIKQIRWERDIALSQLEEIGCSLGQDMTHIKEKLDIASDKEYKLELTRHELDSLKTFIRNHNQPCRDCMMDYDCDVFLRGSCIAKNMDDVLRKLNKLG